MISVELYLAVYISVVLLQQTLNCFLYLRILMHLNFTLQLHSHLFFLFVYVTAFSLYPAIRLSIDILLFVRVELHCVVSHNLAFVNQKKKTARALTLGTVRDIFARARKGFMTKMVWRPRGRD